MPRAIPFLYSMQDRIDLGRMLDQHYPDPADQIGIVGAELRSRPEHRHAGPPGRPECRCPGADRLPDQGRGGHADAGADAPAGLGHLPRPRRAAGGGGAQPGLRRPSRHRLSLQPGRRGAGACSPRCRDHACLDGDLRSRPGLDRLRPTNGTIGGQDLIRVAAARDIHQIVPIAGSFQGAAEDFLGMEVAVTVQPRRGPGSCTGRATNWTSAQREWRHRRIAVHAGPAVAQLSETR